MKIWLQKFLAFFLVVIVIASLMVIPAHASEPGLPLLAFLKTIIRAAPESVVSVWDSLSTEAVFGGYPMDAIQPEELIKCCDYYNQNYYSTLQQAFNNAWIDYDIFNSLNRTPASIRYDSNTGYHRIFDYNANDWATTAYGRYPYCLGSDWKICSDNIRDGGNVAKSVPRDVKWVDEEEVDYSKTSVVTEQSVSDYVTKAMSEGKNASMVTVLDPATTYSKNKAYYTVVRWRSGINYILCNAQGYPIVARPEPQYTAMAHPYAYNNYNFTIYNNDYSVTNNNEFNDNSSTTLIDQTGGTFLVPTVNGDWIEQYTNNVVYNSDDHSYTVTTYDYHQVYNITNNYYYYEYNYYTYNIQYTYNNTYVTYIGSSAEYVPTEFELYYELPDGRSSADLTEEDIAGLSFQFTDVLNYKKSATDTSLRALYHFDGNTNDSSFWSGQGDFTWNTGASITYMESNAFNGALYLDEKAHQFTITLPSNIRSADFTLQWRYYQNSATTSNNNENYVMFGSTKLLGWSEQTLYNGSGTKVGDLSVGTWQELALVRDAGTVYIYHNGVRLSSVTLTSALSDTIVFYLGANSRAYSMLDELRFVSSALVKGGAAYTPTAVPFDTNSILVLPDGATPIADAYYSFDTSITPVKSFDFNSSTSTNLGSPQTLAKETVQYTNYDYTLQHNDFKYRNSSSTYIPRLSSFYVYNGGIRDSFSNPSSLFSISGSNSWSKTGTYNNKNEQLYNDLTYTLSINAPAFIFEPVLSAGSSYTFSLVDSDLNRYSVSYSLPVIDVSGSNYNGSWSSSRSIQIDGKYWSYDGWWFSYVTTLYYKFSYSDIQEYDWGRMFVVSIHFKGYGVSGVRSFCCYQLKSGKSLDLMYAECVPGNTPNTNHQYVETVYSSDEIQPNTAAIQSDIPVNGYTVGGVRPTFPQRGDVWFPVEGNRISGVYIYNGQAWEETNARWWTGKRWIPIYAFDIVTLADLWDVTDASGETVTPAITSDYSFWNWWKNAWNSFTDKLFGVLGGSGSGGGGSGGDSSSSGKGFFEKIKDALADGISKIIDALSSAISSAITAISSAVTDLLSALMSFVTETVLGGIKSFFSSFTDGSLFEFFQTTEVNEEGEEVTTAALPEGIAAVFALFSGIIMLLPWEIRAPLFFLIGALVLISVFKFVLS